MVYCDALKICLGCMLMKNEKFIAYASRKIKVHEKNYLTHNIELVVVVFVFKMLRRYLYGVHVDVFTNHDSLKFVFG